MRATLCAMLLLACLGQVSPVFADWQTRSWSRWVIEEESAEVLFGIEPIELQRMRASVDIDWLRGELYSGLRLGDAERACAPRTIEQLPAGDALLQFRLLFDCGAASAGPVVRSELFLSQPGSPLHYAQIRLGVGDPATVLFTRAEPRALLARVPQPETVPATVLRYLILGFEHILAGADHVAFLLCMLLVAPGLGARLLMITGFTLGHSITLSLSVLGFVTVETAAVEALIGFTVALLAVEVFARAQRTCVALLLLMAVLAGLALDQLAGGAVQLPLTGLLALLVLTPCYLMLALRVPRPEWLHLGMTGMFGLVHGVGFAAALASFGLPAAQRGWALAGFNAGVEMGQLVLLLVFALLIRLVRNWQLLPGSLTGMRAASGFLCALGVYWLVQRSIG